MGVRQSKRSVDISGKEAEGEVVGVGGEGKLEPIADIDTLKPQQNGDTAHGEESQISTDKEKPTENGAPAIEKETEAEKKTEQDVVANGTNNEDKATEEKLAEENDESKPAVEGESKKVKKDKVKKKWSLRSISFSRKDKPKHEKKVKDDENKTNGESEKLAEETAEPEAIETKAAESESVDVSSKDKEEKTPETPVTEPITNGSSASETPKEDITPSDEKPTPTEEKKEEVTPEQPKVAPVEPVAEESLQVQNGAVDNKELPTTEDNAANIEVCVSQEESSPPPPLPDHPPPSSVTVFAETTMVQHLVETSLTEKSSELISNLTEYTEKSDLTETPITEKPSDVVSNLTESIEKPELITEINTQTNESSVDCTVTLMTNSNNIEETTTSNNDVNEIEIQVPSDSAEQKPILDAKSVEEIKEFVTETLETGENVVNEMISKNTEETSNSIEVDPSKEETKQVKDFIPTTNGVQTEVVEHEMENGNVENDSKICNGKENGMAEEIMSSDGNVGVETSNVKVEEMKKKIIINQEQIIEEFPSPVPDEITDSNIQSECETQEMKNGDQEESSSASELSLPPPPEPEITQEIVNSVSDKLGELTLPEAVPEIIDDLTVTTNKEVVAAGEN